MIKSYQVFTTSDGKTFTASEADPNGSKAYMAASQHEQSLTDAKVAVFDPDPEIQVLTRRFETFMRGTVHQRTKFPDREFGWEHRMPLLLLVEDKYGTYHHLITNRSDCEKAGKEYLTSRANAGYWYVDEAEKIAKGIIATENWQAAFIFLSERDGQYEKFEISEFSSL